MKEIIDFKELVTEQSRLSELLKENLAMLEKLGGIPIQPVTDKMVTAKQVREILKISNTTLTDYTKKGILKRYYLPDSDIGRYWLSEVMALPKEVKENAG